TGYCLIPWTGVMAAGYGFGALLRFPRARRRLLVFLLGGVVTLAFVLLRAWNQYGDPRPWQTQSSFGWTVLSFLNCTKYPASLLYLLMTLGPALLALAIFDRPLGPLGRRVVVFGRVPFFFYLLHVPLIHGGAVLCDVARFGWSPLANNGPWFRPDNIPLNYGVSLPTVYLVWIAVEPADRPADAGGGWPGGSPAAGGGRGAGAAGGAGAGARRRGASDERALGSPRISIRGEGS